MDIQILEKEWTKSKFPPPDLLLARDNFGGNYLVMEIQNDLILRVVKIPQTLIPSYRVYSIPLAYCKKYKKYYVIENIDKLSITSCKTPFAGVETFVISLVRKYFKSLNE